MEILEIRKAAVLPVGTYAWFKQNEDMAPWSITKYGFGQTKRPGVNSNETITWLASITKLGEPGRITRDGCAWETVQGLDHLSEEDKMRTLEVLVRLEG